MKGAIARLSERLDDSFVIAGTVTGDKGIKTCASRMQTSSLDLLRLIIGEQQKSSAKLEA